MAVRAGQVALVIALTSVYFALWASLPPDALGAAGQPVIDGYMEPNGYTQVTTLTSSTSLGTIPAGTKLVMIQAESQDVRWRDDGVAPTASVGMVIPAGQTLTYTSNAAAFRAIEAAASAKLNVTFYK